MKLQWKQRGTVDHELIWGSIALVGLVACAVLPVDRIMDTAGYRCPFRTIAGVRCPTCRGTRTLAAMGSLKFREGFALNPLVAVGWGCAVLYVPYALFVSLCGTRRLRVTGLSVRQRRATAAVVVCVVLANWVYLIAT